MSTCTDPSPSSPALLLLLGVLVFPLFQLLSPGQDDVPGPPLPGWVLVDDMWLPPEAVGGDSFWSSTAWPSGNVPYAFASNVSQVQQAAFLRAAADLEAVCDVDFFPRTSQGNYILVRQYANMQGGQSPVGMIGGAQELAVSPTFNGKIGFLHEMMHALGFEHEQSRTDRDTYVTINSNNIRSTCGNQGNLSCAGNFSIVSSGNNHGPYDFLSVMHYNQNTWSNGNGPTITCKTGYTQFQNLMGMGQNMSYGDAAGLRARYNPSTLFPWISGMDPGGVVQNGGNTTVRIFGSNFYEGSLDGGGVLGTQVLVNGLSVSTLSVTYISTSAIDVVIPAFHLINSGCLEIRVENTFVGTSPAWYLVVSPATPTPGFWTGTAYPSKMGYAVTGIGDVDDDGYGDIVVGSPAESFSGVQWGGRVTCYSGHDGTRIWTQQGVNPRGNGSALANAGDVNGDGYDDVIDGAPGTYGSSPGQGYVMLRSGRTGTIIRTYTAGAANDGFGSSVANAGDVNGDGIPDQIIGIPNAGQVRIYSGANGSVLRTINGSVGWRFGAAVAGGYDLNGDGVPDQVVGAPLHRFGRGEAYFYSGANGALLSNPLGDLTGDLFGSTLAMMPSPDGRPGGAVVVGAPGASSDTGFVRIFGPLVTGGTAAIYPVLGTLDGAAPGDQFGTSVAPAGDIDQDGNMDIAVGAGQLNAGPGYVNVYTGRSLHRIASFTGGMNGDWFGASVAAVGEANGDGLPDLVVGAPDRRIGGCAQVGYAQLLHPIVPPAQRKVMLTEVYWGGTQGVEIMNFDLSPVSLAGWRVVWDDGTRRVSNPFPAGVTIAPGEAIIVREPVIVCIGCPPPPISSLYSEAPDATRYFTLFPLFTPGTGVTRVSLITNGGIVIDDVRLGQVQPSIPPLVNIGGEGAFFRGIVSRTTASVSAERIWGLDSNTGGDWTLESRRSFGLESRSSGSRGADGFAVPAVIINEVDDDPDYVELRNVSGGPVDLRNWFLRASPRQNSQHAIIRPWPDISFVLQDGAFVVLGDGPAVPPEMTASVPYVNLSGLPNGGGGNLPWITDEYDCALYDAYGRLVDIVRTTGRDDLRVHNHPRSPGHWSAFTGAAPRSAAGSGATGRSNTSADTNTGADWRALYTRTMGAVNAPATYASLPGHGHRLDVRLNAALQGRGLAVIINAGPNLAGYRWSFLFTDGHQHGQGIFFGLGPSALSNWLILSQTPPWFGTLDAQGSARLDIPGLTLPTGLMTDDIFILQSPSGALSLRTAVIEWDT